MYVSVDLAGLWLVQCVVEGLWMVTLVALGYIRSTELLHKSE